MSNFNTTSKIKTKSALLEVLVNQLKTRLDGFDASVEINWVVVSDASSVFTSKPLPAQ